MAESLEARKARVKKEKEESKAVMMQAADKLKRAEEEEEEIEREAKALDIDETNAELERTQSELRAKMEESLHLEAGSVQHIEEQFIADQERLRLEHEARVKTAREPFLKEREKCQKRLDDLAGLVRENENRKRDLRHFDSTGGGEIVTLSSVHGGDSSPVNALGTTLSMKVEVQHEPDVSMAGNEPPQPPDMTPPAHIPSAQVSENRNGTASASRNSASGAQVMAAAPVFGDQRTRKPSRPSDTPSGVPKTRPFFKPAPSLKPAPSFKPANSPKIPYLKQYTSVNEVGGKYVELDCPVCHMNYANGSFFKGIRGLNVHIKSHKSHKDEEARRYLPHECIAYTFDAEDQKRLRNDEYPVSYLPQRRAKPTSDSTIVRAAVGSGSGATVARTGPPARAPATRSTTNSVPELRTIADTAAGKERQLESAVEAPNRSKEDGEISDDEEPSQSYAGPKNAFDMGNSQTGRQFQAPTAFMGTPSQPTPGMPPPAVRPESGPLFRAVGMATPAGTPSVTRISSSNPRTSHMSPAESLNGPSARSSLAGQLTPANPSYHARPHGTPTSPATLALGTTVGGAGRKRYDHYSPPRGTSLRTQVAGQIGGGVHSTRVAPGRTQTSIGGSRVAEENSRPNGNPLRER